MVHSMQQNSYGEVLQCNMQVDITFITLSTSGERFGPVKREPPLVLFTM